MICTWYYLFFFIFLNSASQSSLYTQSYETDTTFSASCSLYQSQENGLSAKGFLLNYPSNQQRTKKYEQAAAQQAAYEQAYNNYVFEKSKEPRCALHLNDGPKLILVLNQWNEALKKAQTFGDTELIERLFKRVETFKKTEITNARSRFNSDIESLLVQEFKGAYTSVQNLATQFPQNIQVKMALPVIIECADAAFQESNIETAFLYSDFAHDLVTMVRGTIKGITILGRGAYYGAKTALSLEHWKQMALGMQNLAKVIGKKGLELLDVVGALDSGNQKYCDKVISAFHERGAAEYAVLQDHFKKSWHAIQEKTCDELLESGVEIGALMLLDTVIMNGAGYAATAAGRKFVSEVATVFKQGDTVREAYCAEVATVGKLLIEDESATFAVLKKIEKHSEEILKSEISIAKILKEEAEIAQLKDLILQEHIKNLKGKVPEPELLRLAQKAFEQKNFDQQQKIKNIFKDTTKLQSNCALQFEKGGGYKEALTEFENLELHNIKPLKTNDGFYGYLQNGNTVNARIKSTFDKPTLEFQEKRIGKKPKYKKIRYIEKE